MSRKKNTNVSSFDLLLDTICNTFGGVLFISMLVVVLLSMTSREVTMTPPSKASQAELVECKRELAETVYEMRRLGTAVEEQEKVERMIDAPELRRLVEHLRRSQSTRADLENKKSANLDEIGRSQIEINRIARELKERDEAMAAARRNVEAAERLLKAEIRLRSRTAKLPKVRETTKKEAAFFLRKGRLCAYDKRDSNGNLVPNTEECREQKVGDVVFVEPKENAGTLVNLSGDTDGRIAKTFNDFDKDQHYLAVFVWPDSFEHFATLKDIVVKNGFEYRLVPFPEGETIPVGAASEEVQKVQ